MFEKYLPCPFCNHAPIIFKEVCYCSNEDCFMTAQAHTPFTQWNTRPIEDALQSQIDQLKTQLSGITQYGSIDAAEKIDRLTKERDALKEDIKRLNNGNN